MQLGMIGLGRMGSNMVRRLMKGGHECVVFDLDPANVARLAGEGATGASSIDDLAAKLKAPRAVWVMVPAGDATEKTVGDARREACRRATRSSTAGTPTSRTTSGGRRTLSEKGLHYVDAGTSGGVWGLERGYCLMVGGPDEAVRRLDPIFATLAPGAGSIDRTPGREGRGGTAERGYLHCGPSGAGHFVKMVHNGIEYGLMQAYAEGFDILKGAAGDEVPEAIRYRIDLADVAEVWRRGSVVGSWLLDLTSRALAKDAALEGFTGFVHDSGEGRWTVQAAVEEAVPAHVITAALYARFRSRETHTFGEKLLSAMRNEFGGHQE